MLTWLLQLFINCIFIWAEFCVFSTLATCGAIVILLLLSYSVIVSLVSSESGDSNFKLFVTFPIFSSLSKFPFTSFISCTSFQYTTVFSLLYCSSISSVFAIILGSGVMLQYIIKSNVVGVLFSVFIFM